MGQIILTGQELYNRAWSTPLDRLARELGLSGRGLGKLCARCNIPVPPRGYWAKRAAGKRVSQPPLPRTIMPTQEGSTFQAPLMDLRRILPTPRSIH